MRTRRKARAFIMNQARETDQSYQAAKGFNTKRKQFWHEIREGLRHFKPKSYYKGGDEISSVELSNWIEEVSQARLSIWKRIVRRFKK